MNIIETIISNQLIPPVLYHYTSPSRFIDIVEGRCLLAFNLQHIKNNDSFEYTIELVEKELREQLKHKSRLLRTKGKHDGTGKQIKLLSELTKRLSELARFHIFIVSLTQDGDAKSSWQDYCPKGIGVSIGFDAAHLNELAQQQGFILAGCCHTRREQENAVKALIGESVDKIKTEDKNASEWLLTLNNTADEFATKTVQLAALFKHPHCSEKSEWRLLAMPTPILPTNSSIRFMGNDLMPAPYLKFMLSDNTGMASLIPKVIIGPAPDKKLSRGSLELFLSARALESITITHSRIPYSSHGQVGKS